MTYVFCANDPSEPLPITRTTADVREDIPKVIRIRIRDALAGRDGWALTDAQLSALEEFVDWLRTCAAVEKDDPNLADGLALLVATTIITQVQADDYLAAWPEA